MPLCRRPERRRATRRAGKRLGWRLGDNGCMALTAGPALEAGSAYRADHFGVSPEAACDNVRALSEK